MRGVYHWAEGIEKFLLCNPVRYPSVRNDNVYFTKKGCEVFWELLKECPGPPPTDLEFQERYWSYQKDKSLRLQEAYRGRMRQLYIGLMRDYHAGSLLVEDQAISHVWWDPVIDADYGIDYVVCSAKRYAAVHVTPGRGDPNAWVPKKAQRKDKQHKLLSVHVELPASAKNCVGGIFLVTRKTVSELAAWIANGNGSLWDDVPFHEWAKTGLQEVARHESNGQPIQGRELFV